MRRRAIRIASLAIALAAIGGAGCVLWVGSRLVAAAPAEVGAAPADIPAQRIALGDAGEIAGWWIPSARPHAPAVLLLHGIRADRRAMLGRARVLHAAGYGVLLVDLPAHGESAGDAITLGVRESKAVALAHHWLQREQPGRRTAAIGVSLGGAAILFDDSGARFDAVVLEAVYADARDALRNRIAIRTGDRVARILAPLLEVQVEPRTGVTMDALRPVDRIAALGAPVLILAGARDRHTTPADSLALFERAAPPRELHVFPGAVHVDFLRADPAGWRAAVLPFLSIYLDAPPDSSAATSPAANGQSSSVPDTSSRSTGTRKP